MNRHSRVVLWIGVVLGVVFSASSGYPFSQLSPVTRIGHEFITVEGAKKAGLNSSSFGGGVPDDKYDDASEDYNDVQSLNVYAAVIGERWADLMGVIKNPLFDSAVCFDAVPQNPDLVQYDHFLRKSTDGRREGALRAVNLSTIRFKQLFVDAAMAEDTGVTVLDGGGDSAPVPDLPDAYVRFGRALHLLQDSFSAEHAVRALDNEGKEILDILSYSNTAGSHYHVHEWPWPTDENGDLLHFDDTDNLKREAASAVSATSFAWSRFEEAHHPKSGPRTKDGAEQAAQAVVNEWMKFTADKYPQDPTKLPSATDLAYNKQTHPPRSTVGPPLDTNLSRNHDRCLQAMSATQVNECVPQGWTTWTRPPFVWDADFDDDDIEDDWVDSDSHPVSVVNASCPALGIPATFNIVKYGNEHISPEGLFAYEGEMVPLYLTRPGTFAPVPNRLDGSLPPGMPTSFIYTAPSSIPTRRVVTLQATAAKTAGVETTLAKATTKITLVPKLHFAQGCPASLRGGETAQFEVKEDTPVTWHIDDSNERDTVTITDRKAALTAATPLDITRFSVTCSDKQKSSDDPRIVNVLVVADDGREATCNVVMPGVVHSKRFYPGTDVCGGVSARRPFKPADQIRVKPGDMVEFVVRAGRVVRPIQVNPVNSLKPGLRLGGRPGLEVQKFSNLAAIHGALAKLSPEFAAKTQVQASRFGQFSAMSGATANGAQLRNGRMARQLKALQKTARSSLKGNDLAAAEQSLGDSLRNPARAAAAGAIAAHVGSTYAAPAQVAAAQAVDLKGTLPNGKELRFNVKVE